MEGVRGGGGAAFTCIWTQVSEGRGRGRATFSTAPRRGQVAQAPPCAWDTRWDPSLREREDRIKRKAAPSHLAEGVVEGRVHQAALQQRVRNRAQRLRRRHHRRLLLLLRRRRGLLLRLRGAGAGADTGWGRARSADTPVASDSPATPYASPCQQCTRCACCLPTPHSRWALPRTLRFHLAVR